jgi:lipoyl-dependent peroxiredoxin
MAQLQRTGDAVWQGDLRGGNGKVTTGSGAIREQAYSFRTRFENEPGTNPEELIAAAHAACYSMALSAGLANAGFTPESVHTRAVLTMEQEADDGAGRRRLGRGAHPPGGGRQGAEYRCGSFPEPGRERQAELPDLEAARPGFEGHRFGGQAGINDHFLYAANSLGDWRHIFLKFKRNEL